ncbi:hypothetical protein BDW75DRAFT_225184 [Aspergillus navahoensis]
MASPHARRRRSPLPPNQDQIVTLNPASVQLSLMSCRTTRRMSRRPSDLMSM